MCMMLCCMGRSTSLNPTDKMFPAVEMDLSMHAAWTFACCWIKYCDLRPSLTKVLPFLSVLQNFFFSVALCLTDIYRLIVLLSRYLGNITMVAHDGLFCHHKFLRCVLEWSLEHCCIDWTIFRRKHLSFSVTTPYWQCYREVHGAKNHDK